MEFTLLCLTDSGRYWDEEQEDASLGIFLYFLNLDVEDESRALSFKKWAVNEKWQYTSGNLSLLEKNYGSIIIKDIFTEESDDQVFCEIRLQNFIEILDKWAEIAKEKPPYIVLVDGGNGNISLGDL